MPSNTVENGVICGNEITFPYVAPGIDVRVTLEVYEEDGSMVCGLRFMEGEINLPPSKLRKALTDGVKTIERIVKAAGCVEMRHAGACRKWFLPDYERMPILNHGMRKRL